jgi:hypothetical protein
MTGSLVRGAVLKMGHSFLQWSGTLRGHLVTEEGDLGYSKDTSPGWLGSRTSKAGRGEPPDVARALRATRR